MAISDDGISFPPSSRLDHPVLYPDNDAFKAMEWQGGCEDPRVVESEDGTYVMTYTSYNGLARLMVATSKDLLSWEKHGSAFAHAHGGAFSDAWYETM